MCLPIICFGALFDRPGDGEMPVYTVQELNTAFVHLETYYGDCSAIFRAEGISIELCTVTLDFAKRIEVRARGDVLDTPAIAEQAWRDGLFADYNTFFADTKYALMFAALTQNQFDQLLNKVIFWVDDYDDQRTFAEFKTILAGEKKILVAISLVCMLSFSAFSAELFHVDIGTGSFKDRVTGTLPTNSDVVMAVGGEGTVGRFGGVNALDYGRLPTLEVNDFSIVIIEKNTHDNFGVLFSEGVKLSENKGVLILWGNTSTMLRIYVGTLTPKTFPIPPIRGQWNLYIFTVDGVECKLYANNILYTVSDLAAPLSAYDTTGVALGERQDVGSQKNIGDIALVKKYSHILTANERAELYQEYLRRTNILKSMVVDRGTSDMIVSWSADDHLRADGRTVTTGDLDGLHVASGSFQAKENASGKSIECLTSGTLQIQGIDLSEFVGNGWIQSLGGSLSAEAGQTVDDATNVSFTDNTLSIALTAGQIFSGIVITPN
jgi:hypothetical protein